MLISVRQLLLVLVLVVVSVYTGLLGFGLIVYGLDTSGPLVTQLLVTFAAAIPATLVASALLLLLGVSVRVVGAAGLANALILGTAYLIGEHNGEQTSAVGLVGLLIAVSVDVALVVPKINRR